MDGGRSFRCVAVTPLVTTRVTSERRLDEILVVASEQEMSCHHLLPHISTAAASFLGLSRSSSRLLGSRAVGRGSGRRALSKIDNDQRSRDAKTEFFL